MRYTIQSFKYETRVNGKLRLDKTKPYFVFDVTGGLAGLKKTAYGKVPDGGYWIFTKDGELNASCRSVRIDSVTKKNAEKKRPHMSKEAYDQLYYYVIGDMMDNVRRGESPLMYTSPRRYDTLNDVRKAALVKSHKVFNENKSPYSFRKHSIEMAVFRGRSYIGSVYYDHMGLSDGLWYPKGSNDPILLRKDGSA